MKVKDIMTKKPLVVQPDTTIEEIEKIFKCNNFWSIYVGTSDNFVGVITRKDLQNKGTFKSPSTPVSSIMSRGVISIDENADVDDARRILSAKRINGIAVTKNGNHIGVVTEFDLKSKVNPLKTRIFKYINRFSAFVIGAITVIIIFMIGVGLLVLIFSSPQVQNGLTPNITKGQPTGNSGIFPSPTLDSMELETRIHELINQQRNSYGLSSLSFDPSLATIARNHSQDMATNNYFSHIDLQGRDPIERGDQEGYPCIKNYGSYYTYGIAENIFEHHHSETINGMTVNDLEPLETIAQITVTGWMNSTGHRENILNSTYDKEGIGVAISSEDTVYMTEDFC